MFHDVSEKKRSERLLEEQKHALELIAQHGNLKTKLDALCLLIEGQSRETRLASILLDGEDDSDRIVAAGSILPKADNAHRWSRRIVSSRDEPLGVLILDRRGPDHPSPEDLKLIDVVIRTAATAIKQDRDRADLVDARTRLESALMAGEIATWTWDLVRDRVTPDAYLARLFSIPPKNVAGSPVAEYLEVASDRGNLWVGADPTRLEQVVVNLLNNAAKYSENSGRIRLEARNESGQVVIQVCDQGVRIAPEKLPRMFDVFAQGDRSPARSEGGLGIGLTVVKKLIEMHGGTISARSEGVGKGSDFTIRLPSASKPAATRSDAPISPSTATEPRKARILVVDDNVDTARGMARLLKLIGHTTSTAHSGPEAIEAARQHRPRPGNALAGLNAGGHAGAGVHGGDAGRRIHGRGSPSIRDRLILSGDRSHHFRRRQLRLPGRSTDVADREADDQEGQSQEEQAHAEEPADVPRVEHQVPGRRRDRHDDPDRDERQRRGRCGRRLAHDRHEVSLLKRRPGI